MRERGLFNQQYDRKHRTHTLTHTRTRTRTLQGGGKMNKQPQPVMWGSRVLAALVQGIKAAAGNKQASEVRAL